MLSPFRTWHVQADEAFFVIADLHMLTTDPTATATGRLRRRLHQLVAEIIAVGIDPGRVHILQQSQLVEQGQMYAIIQSLIPWQPLTDQPSYREMSTYADPTLGLLGYPVLEAADALVLRVTDQAVGEHNVPHVEISRLAATRLNQEWDLGLPVPNARSGGRNLLGLDGSLKMSKSLGNAIPLSSTDAEIDAAIDRMTVLTPDGRCVPAHIIATLTRTDQSELATAATNGDITEPEIRAAVSRTVRDIVVPVREQAAKIMNDPGYIEDLLAEGARTARCLAQETLQVIRDGMQINPPARDQVGAAREAP